MKKKCNTAVNSTRNSKKANILLEMEKMVLNLFTEYQDLTKAIRRFTTGSYKGNIKPTSKNKTTNFSSSSKSIKLGFYWALKWSLVVNCSTLSAI